MISLKSILNIIATEALEHAGVLEVPDHKHGAAQNYSTPKRDARNSLETAHGHYAPTVPVLRYDLELVRRDDGTVSWEE
jgi:hypothetical protein